MNVEVIDKGLLSLIVDAGRTGRQQDGFCQSGPMDEDAFLWANFLAFNPDNTPCFEAIGNLTVTVDAPCVIAATGRAVQLTVNGHPKAGYRSEFVAAGAEISVGSEQMGCKAYLAIAGAWNVPVFAQSACTVPRERLGGLEGNGNTLTNGDHIEINAYPTSTLMANKVRAIALQNRNNYSLAAPIRIIPGYQYAHFSRAAQRMLVTSEYTVTSSIDRMGYRLSGPDVACDIQKMRSEAIHLGAIQVPPDGQPIVMMRDRQTLGGYPKIGCVNPLDVNRLAQATPGETLHFVYQNNEAARADCLLALCRRRQLQGEML
jgi:biotin-dependent carboxylase-like uncharacterized protein